MIRKKFLPIAFAIALLVAMAGGVFTTLPASAHSLTPLGTDKSVTHCLGAAAFPLNDLCVTTNYTVYSSTNEQISSVKGCVDVQGPASYAVIGTQVDVYNQGPKVWSQSNQTLT